MKTILIGTTAINRPPLHSDVLPDWIKWIRQLKGYEMRWFVNVDMVEKLPYSLEETQENLRGIAGTMGLEFLGGEKGNFLKACRRVAKRIEEYVRERKLREEDVMVFWLEDDWKLNLGLTIPLRRVIDLYMGERCHVNFSFIRNNYIHALAPGLISYGLWRDMHLAAWKAQKTHIDPEHCVGKYVRKVMKVDESKICNLTVVTGHKEVSEGYFEKNKFCNYEKSYFTFDDDKRVIVSDRYVEKGNVRRRFGGEILFVRITAKFCNDCGREYMERIGMSKVGVQDEKNKNFYNL